MHYKTFVSKTTMRTRQEAVGATINVFPFGPFTVQSFFGQRLHSPSHPHAHQSDKSRLSGWKLLGKQVPARVSRTPGLDDDFWHAIHSSSGDRWGESRTTRTCFFSFVYERAQVSLGLIGRKSLHEPLPHSLSLPACICRPRTDMCFESFPFRINNKEKQTLRF